MMFGQFVMVEYDDQLYYTKVAAGRLAGMENSAPPRRAARSPVARNPDMYDICWWRSRLELSLVARLTAVSERAESRMLAFARW
jgi:hypothetical protein